MRLLAWCGLFALTSAFSWWIIAGSGAKWIAGWKSLFLVNVVALDWNAEQIRLYVLIIWLADLVWFVVGVIHPALRTPYV